ncbi:hypothetical protein Cni_G07381 [Canna indica]|uniref:AAA+ ATPase domain-containing protein n=1 Tax=Canna indica TaxID=4628 RepID=A0AAQ3K095_9LILI|nr:hypothetical protein Cni_G07381 [Canna indica]
MQRASKFPRLKGKKLAEVGMASADNKMLEKYKKAVTTAASVAASLMLARTLINDLVPYELRDLLFSRLDGLRSRLYSEQTIVIDQAEGHASNLVFDAARTYLSSRMNRSMRRLRVLKLDEHETMAVSMAPDEEMVDVFDGVEFRWRMLCHEVDRSSNSNYYYSSATKSQSSFEISFHQKHKDLAFDSYLPFVLERAKSIKDQERKLQLHMNEGCSWCPIDLRHPSTFDTLAIDQELKSTIMADLERFMNRREYYRRIGKAWKRGYLLYGPPGTGKSSLVAAMANHLKFDIYDLELAEVYGNTTLRQLLVGMSNRSILVVEDIDCAIDLQKRDDAAGSNENPDQEKITLSGLLNFIDGLWSTSGEERIIVLTTNYKDRLDPALLRPGRMDMHIHMSYCGTHAFRVLAENYHAVKEHRLFAEIEGLIGEVEVTPAEVAEELMRSDDADVALQGLLQLLIRKQDH